LVNLFYGCKTIEMINQKIRLANEVRMENEVSTIIDVPQWKLIRDREQISEENLY
jgi:hypothetical protein